MSEQRRTFVVIWIANLLSALGMMSFLPFFPSVVEGLGVEDRGSVALWSGVCHGAAPFMAALMGPFWGAFGDRYGRKLMVVRSMLALTVFVGLMSFARTPLELLVLRLGQGMFSGFLPPSITLVSVGVPNERQGRLAGNLQMAMAAGAIIGPLMGGILAAKFGVGSLFVWVALMTGAAGLLVALVAEERREPGELSPGENSTGFLEMLHGLGRDLKALWQRPRMRAGLLLLFVTQFGVGATNPQLELFVRDLSPDLGAAVHQSRTGMLFTAMAVANLIAMPIWGRFGDRIGHLRALIVASAGCSLALGATVFVTTFAALLVARIGLSLAGAAMGPCAFALAGSEAPAHRRGSSYGAVFSSRTLSLSLSAGLGGGLVSVLGIHGLFGAAAVTSGSMSLFGWFERRRHGRPAG